jgi:hypothetical protein
MVGAPSVVFRVIIILMVSVSINASMPSLVNQTSLMLISGSFTLKLMALREGLAKAWKPSSKE